MGGKGAHWLVLQGRRPFLISLLSSITDFYVSLRIIPYTGLDTPVVHVKSVLELQLLILLASGEINLVLPMGG